MNNTFLLAPTCPKESEDLIETLSLGKTLGPNSILTKLLKQLSKANNILLDKLIKFFLEKGIFPDSLKLASVISIFKKGNSLECNNYHFISLNSNISKV